MKNDIKYQYNLKMSQIDFIYNNSKTIIQCQGEDKLENIIERFLAKIQKKKDSIYFIYNGEKLEVELTFNEVANSLGKNNNVMTVLAFDHLVEKDKTSFLIKSKNIICPECNEDAHISINEFKIRLYDCANHHNIENIKLNEFEKTQYINQSKIICDSCRIKNKSETFQNKFFKCFNCKLNLCPLCRVSHNKSHYIFDYEDKDFYCKNHSEAYVYYCKFCKIDICSLCENQHLDHEKISYGSIMPDIEESKKELESLNIRISKAKKDIEDIISKLNKLTQNLDIYFKIYSDIINNFDIRKRNYSTLQNIIDIRKYNSKFMINISEIINDKNIKTKFNDLMEMMNKICLEDENNNEEKRKNEIKKEDNKKKVMNTGNNNSKIEEINNGSDNIKNNNFSDDKYEKFNLNKLKELQSFECKYEIIIMKILNDKRLLSYQEDNSNNIYKIIVYDVNSIICDINYDTIKIEEIFLMKDNNIIIFSNPFILKVFEIKSKSMEEIGCFSEFFDKEYNLLNDKILLVYYRKISVFEYSNGKIINCKKNFEKKDWEVEDICNINKNEIAIYYSKDGTLFGMNAFILFYDLESLKDIKTIKLGDRGYGDYGQKIILLNDIHLVVSLKGGLVLIDAKNRAIKKEYHLGIYVKQIFGLNDKLILINNGQTIYQYLIEKFNPKLVEEKSIDNSLISKYHDNKIIIIENKIIYIYG